ncbi:MAG: M13 family metallopeptidase [Candidatus Rehaiarchaeum fermentans]|nr:M13 family metallopeptidase [Candidatus Rehaiarchaeum fermentans]
MDPIAKWVEDSIDPLDDFYNYANGKLIPKLKIPADLPEIDQFILLKKKVNRQLIKILMQPKDEIERKLSKLYASYMNLNLIEKEKFNPITEIINKILEVKDRIELISVLGELSRTGKDIMLDIRIEADLKSPKTYALYVNQDGLNLLDKKQYLESKYSALLDALKYTIQKINFLYFKESLTNEELNKLIKLEINIAKFSRTSEELRDVYKNYNPLSIASILRKYRNIHIGYIKEYSSSIIVGQPEFLRGINQILTSESLDTLKRYAITRLLLSYSSALHGEAARTVFQLYGKVLAGQKRMKARALRGLDYVNSLMGDALGIAYAKRYFSISKSKEIEKMVFNIRNAFKERLSRLKWMSEKTKSKAIEKLDELGFEIGYPKAIRDYTTLKLYKHPLDNIFSIVNYKFLQDLEKVGKTVDDRLWEMGAHIVNAYYEPTRNKMYLPAAILQPPFFSEKWDEAVNYGRIGCVIGHEITHGFDDQGRLFDKNGKLKNWWSDEDNAKFEQLKKKIVEMYSSVEVYPSVKINGMLTAGENIADIGGVRIAFEALRKNVRSYSINGFSSEQRFAIAYAQTWSGRERPEFLKAKILIDPHSPLSVRGNIPITTMPEFEIIFKDKTKHKEIHIKEDISIW